MGRTACPEFIEEYLVVAVGFYRTVFQLMLSSPQNLFLGQQNNPIKNYFILSQTTWSISLDLRRKGCEVKLNTTHGTRPDHII